MTTLEFIGSPSAVLAAVAAHWQSLGLDTEWLADLEPDPGSGPNQLWAEAWRDEGHYIVLGTLDAQGNPLTDLVVPDAVADLWKVPLASVDTIEHWAEERQTTLTLPAAGGVALVRAKTPKVQIGGFEKVLPGEDAPDAPVPDEWVQPTGAHDAYPLGAIRSRGGQVWISLIDGNAFEPGVFGWEVVP